MSNSKFIKKLLTALLSASMLMFLAACGNGGENTRETVSVQTENGGLQTVSEEETLSENKIDTDVPNSENTENIGETISENGGKILVAFFSRADENYGVGFIEKGNTHIIADMIAEEMNADTFEIVRVTPYPETYSDCTNEAQEEKTANARPELTETVENFDNYDIIFLGYPNWWGDMPMPVYTFIESYDFSGKTVIPFCTHAGSGLSGTVQTLRGKLESAEVLDGFDIAGTTAQNNQDEAKEDVLAWLNGLDIEK
ncbi:MAG: NAD(P)H-dependent oxidoreductase [Ruminococcus sp.]|nr:NAD(P)H-dependent oxidoreductase [Ruminococcus sp.]MCM1381055.1 NAD(P)H-dependent oxidoreductase [Muribaculaceae bacterium]MCM1480663.1 NAD(P)H-dependent oxidoreductase [Muribaculaceae bacterium]